MAVAGAGARAENMVKVGAGAKNKQFRLRNTAKKGLLRLGLNFKDWGTFREYLCILCTSHQNII